jgi:hypothetical protein
LAAVCAFAIGCATSGPRGSAGGMDLTALAKEITRGVGSLQPPLAPPAGRGSVIVFEERHTSIPGQLELAVMLLRLHERGVRLIGLEGALRGVRLDGSWYRGLGQPEGRAAREEVALALLLEGEISAVELLALTVEDLDVRGLEASELYAIELDVKGWPEAGYLLRLAEAALPPGEAARLAALAAGGRTAEVSAKLLEVDPWITSRWQEMKRADATVEEVAARLRLVRARAETRRVPVEDGLRRDFEVALRFFETAARRSEVMATNLASDMEQASASAGAMVVGLAHGRGVRAALEHAGLAVVSIRPASVALPGRQLSEQAYLRKSRGLWAGTRAQSAGCVLDSRKPPPIIERATAHALLWADNIIAAFARALRDHKDLESVRLTLPASESGRLESVSVDGRDVVLHLSLTDAAGGRTSVWARAHALGGLEEGWVQGQGLEQQLLALLARERAGQPPSPDDEPGAVRLGSDVRAIFGAHQAAIAAVGFKAARDPGSCSGGAH